MPAFAYRAIDLKGKRLDGHSDAASPVALTRALESRGLVVIDVRDATHLTTESGRRAIRGRKQAVLDVTRALAALLPAGVPLARALAATQNIAPKSVGPRLEMLRQQVERGNSLAAALAEQPDLFPRHYVGVVRAGERSGDLDAAFARLATQLEREDELRGKLLSAAIYPILLAVVGTAAVLILLLFVLPRFADLLRGAGAQLPRSTALLLALASGARVYWPGFLILPGLLAMAVMWCRTTEDGARTWSAMLLALPLIGNLRRQALAARFARLTSVLLGGGAPLLSALDDASESIGDVLVRAELRRVRSRVREGLALNRALAEAHIWTPLLPQLVAVGEESGRLYEFLTKAAEIFEQKTERSTTRLVALAEPAMIVVLGAVVGFVALSLLQAIYGINAGAFR